MKSIRMVHVSVAFALVAGCAHHESSRRAGYSEAASPPVVSSADRSIQAPAESVWTAVLGALADRGYEIPLTEKAVWMVTTDWFVTETKHSFSSQVVPFGEKRGEAGATLNAMAVLPETRGARVTSRESPGREGEPGRSGSIALSEEIGVWTKCRHRLSVHLIPLGLTETEVEVRPEIECWEAEKRKTWTPCPGHGLVESQFYDALSARLSP